MATISYCKLCNTRITIKQPRLREMEKEVGFTEVEAAKIIKEVFSDIFPVIFVNVIRALEGFFADPSHTYTGTQAQKSTLDKSPHDPGVLEAKEVHAQMRYFRDAVQMHIANGIVDRIVNGSSADIDFADMRYIDIDLRSTIEDIRNRLAVSGIKGTRGKGLGLKRLRALWFPDEPDAVVKRRLVKVSRDTRVVFALVRVFSISCIWMNPKPFGDTFARRVSGLHQIFNIIKNSDLYGVVQEICDRLEDLTMGYIEAEPRLNIPPGI